LSPCIFSTIKNIKCHIFKYQENEAVISIPDGELLEGQIPGNKLKLVMAWIEIHRDELMADWELASKGENPYKIDPLK